MPKFFFHFFDGDELSIDDFGVEFSSGEHAYLNAMEAARAMWPELLASRVDPRKCRFHITNEAREELFELPLSELLDNCISKPNTYSTSADLHHLLRETDQRAKLARTDLQATMSEVRQALKDSASLVGRLDALHQLGSGRGKLFSRD